MNIFEMHEGIIGDYKRYVESFLTIADSRIREFVGKELFEKRALWPDALLQLNPAYESASTVRELCEAGKLHQECANIFRDKDGSPLRLYRHQQEAIETALSRKHFVVTSGTGSGKTLTYFVPIFDSVLKGDPEESRVRAIIVYPMNALVNSQYDALTRLASEYRSRTGRELPVRFAKYTGQETDAKKESLRLSPPHILLTNYVMLELMLVRPREHDFVDRTATGLQFLVIDELHSYRGRQGADVGLLIRRLRERCGNPDLLCIGTSATMATGESRADRRKAVAEFAAKLFGVCVEPENIIEETLRPVIPPSIPTTAEHLRQALGAPPPEAQWEEFSKNPLSA